MDDDQLQASWTQLHQDYQVRDIFLSSARLMFLLESPHIQELKYDAPVSGSSGATMTKHLFGETYARFPLGRLVKKNVEEHKERPSLNRIGLMNVCNIPMQGSAYGHPSILETHGRLIQSFEHIRSDNQRTVYRAADHNTVQAVLVRHLRDKLQTVVDWPLTLVPCGRFAQKFFRLAAVSSPHWTVIDNVPHPSYNSWDRAQYARAIESVVGALRQDVTI